MLSMMSRRTRAFLFCLALIFSAARTNAASVKDQAFEPSPPDTIPTIFRENRWAQTFTVGISGTLTRVDVQVAQLFFQQPEDLLVTIFDTAGGAPRAPLTAPFHISPSLVPVVPHPSSFDAYAFLSASFALPVTAGDVLAIVLSTGSSSTYYWAGAFAGGYPGGQLYGTTTAVWSAIGTQDQAFRTFVAPSAATPTAIAGANQTVRPGTTVTLDGSGSFDDNTDTNLLLYAWSIVSAPPGSAVTTLDGANTETPSFVPDVFGNYVIQLVVTDQDGFSSLPSQVTVGENLPPTAFLGPDLLLFVGQAVEPVASAFDPDGDPISYHWAFASTPPNSAAELSPTDRNFTSFVVDQPGAYVVTVTPSDFLGPGTPASETIVVITQTDYAGLLLQSAADVLRVLPPDAVTTRGNQQAFVNSLAHVAIALQQGALDDARDELARAIGRTDGCALRGAPDGNGPGRDWVTTCDTQPYIYELLIGAAFLITP